MSSTTIDVVVTNYHTRSDALRFIESFTRCVDAGLEADLWFMDVDPDAGDQPSVEWAVQEAGGLYARFDTNVGYSGACNYAGLLGQGEVIALFNADVELFPGSVEHVVNVLMSDDTYGIAGPKQVDQRNRITAAGIMGTNTQPFLRGWKDTDMGQFDDILDDCVSVSGSAYFVKREVWNILTRCPFFQAIHPGCEGAFLPTPLYYEETWTSYHARAHLYKVVYDGQTSMIHQWHKSINASAGAEAKMPVSQAMFREACAAHGISCD